MQNEIYDVNNRLISIIVPVYNVALYLEDCLDSILKQSFKDYEVICVNDASTDNSGEILQEYAKRHSQIKVITHSKNRGLSAARNTGIANAKGKYIWFVDSDDMIMPNALTELYQVAENGQVDIIYFDMAVIYRDAYRSAIEIYEGKDENGGIYSGRELFCIFVESGNQKSEVCRQFIKRNFLIEQQIEFYDGILHEDEFFSFLCAMSAPKVLNLNRKYYIYRQRPGSIMSQRNSLHAESVFVILIQVLAFWASHKFTDRENEAIKRHFTNLYDAYRYYACFGEKKACLEVGGFVEKALYTMLQTAETSRYLTLDEKQLSHIENANHVIVFGAGKAALDIVNILKRKNIRIDAIAVSDKNNNPETFCGIQVDSIENLAQYIEDALVVIGVTEKYRKGIQSELEKLGYMDIVIASKVVK